MAHTVINTEHAPAAIGPYSQAIQAGALIFTSGQLPIQPDDGVIPENIAQQARQSLKNIQAILERAGSKMNAVVKVVIFLTDIADFPAVNQVYGEFFSAPFPARSCVAVAALPKGAKIEVEAVAVALPM